MKGNINASGYNITATKFIGNLQGKADSAANADLAAKATTAEKKNTFCCNHIGILICRWHALVTVSVPIW